MHAYLCVYMFGVDERRETLYDYIHFVMGIAMERAISITLNGKDSFLCASVRFIFCPLLQFKYKVTIVIHRVAQQFFS